MGLQHQAQVELRAVAGLLQTLGMLSLAHDEVADIVETALADNPMLERAPGHPCPRCGGHIAGNRCHSCTSGPTQPADFAVSPFETFEALAGCEVRSDSRHALGIVLDHLTDRGLLDSDPEEIATSHLLPRGAVTEALRAIKTVGPVGIAERTTPDLLAAQAAKLIDAGDAQPWLVDLVRDHLDLIARSDSTTAARLLGVDKASVAAAFDLVRTRLRPAVTIDRESTPPPRSPPDIFVVRRENGSLEVEVIDSRWFGVCVASIPPHLRADRCAATWLHEHERAARNLLHQLDIRASVLRRVAVYAVQRQTVFFDHGPAGHVRLTRSEVAGELGLHASTVTRAVHGKRLRLPSGAVVDFADLFGGGVAIRAQIAEITRESDLSDTELRATLASRGYVVARRTIAKYRAQLGIAPGAARRT